MENDRSDAGASAAKGAADADMVSSLARGLAIMESFDTSRVRQTATEAARRCGVTRTAAKRHLSTLVKLGYIATDGKHFWLTPAVLRIGHAYLESAQLPRVAYPFLQRVNMAAQGTAQISILDGMNAIYIARDGSSRGMNTGGVIGERIPAQVTAPGLLLVALKEPAAVDAWLADCELKAYTPYTIASKQKLKLELELIRSRRWAISEQQLVPGYRGIAVPLTDRYGNLVAALNVSMPMGNETSDAAVQRVLGPMIQVAHEMRTVIC